MPFRRALGSVIRRLKPARSAPSADGDESADLALARPEATKAGGKRPLPADDDDPPAHPHPDHVLPSIENDAIPATSAPKSKRRKLSSGRHMTTFTRQLLADVSTHPAGAVEAESQERFSGPATPGLKQESPPETSTLWTQKTLATQSANPSSLRSAPLPSTEAGSVSDGPREDPPPTIPQTSLSSSLLDPVPEEPYVAPPLRKSATKIREAKAGHKADMRDPRNKGWVAADRALFDALATIGNKPMLPSAWAWDFPTFPKELFAEFKEDHKDEDAPIKPTYRDQGETDADVAFAKRLGEIIKLGPFTRDGLLLGLPPYKRMTRGMQRCYDWTRGEACVKHTPPNLIIHGGPEQTELNVMLDRMHGQMTELAQTWERAVGHKHTPLYGIICRGAEFDILSFVPDGIPEHPQGNPYRYLRTIATENWLVPGHDVWTSFRFALLVIHCRDLLVHAVYDPDTETDDVGKEGSTKRASCGMM